MDVALAGGKIVLVGGYRGTDGRGDMAVIRLNANGTFDGTFSGDGKQRVHFDALESAESVAIGAGGKIIIAGWSYTAGDDGYVTSKDLSRFAVARVTTAGALDPTFSGDGKLITGFVAGRQNRATAVFTRPEDGKIVAAGWVGWDSDPYATTDADFGLARYLP